MKFNGIIIILTTFLTVLVLLYTPVNSEVVCSEYELVKELREDLADNGKLDCLRESLPVPGETNEEKVKRLAANWDGDCSFESENENFPWSKRLFENYPLIRGLIDVDGNPTNDKNQPEQADMCEIIRTLIGNNMIDGITLVGNGVASLNEDISYYIDCPGGGSESSICAATAGSFADSKGWYIALDGQAMSFNGKPSYEVVQDSAGVSTHSK